MPTLNRLTGSACLKHFELKPAFCLPPPAQPALLHLLRPSRRSPKASRGLTNLAGLPTLCNQTPISGVYNSFCSQRIGNAVAQIQYFPARRKRRIARRNGILLVHTSARGGGSTNGGRAARHQ